MPVITATPSQLASQHRSDDLEAAIEHDPRAFRILSGDRPTGALHVGHYFGSLANRVRLQNAEVELMVLIADYQAITDRTAPADLPGIVLGLVADYLAVGIDPSRATIFAHSQVESLNQLLLPFLSLVSVAEIGRNPTVKEEIAATSSGAVSRADVHLSGPSGRRHLVLSREPRPCRQAISCRTWSSRRIHRPPVQRPLLSRSALLPRAGRAAQRCAAAARHGRPEDEQEPEQLSAAARNRGRDGAAARGGEDRLRVSSSPTTRLAGLRCASLILLTAMCRDAARKRSLPRSAPGAVRRSRRRLPTRSTTSSGRSALAGLHLPPSRGTCGTCSRPERQGGRDRGDNLAACPRAHAPGVLAT